MNAKQQRRQFFVVFIVAVLVLGVVVACSPTIRHNLMTSCGDLWQTLGTSPSDYQSGEALKETKWPQLAEKGG